MAERKHFSSNINPYTGEVLRHGYGGNLRRRNQQLQEIAASRQELKEHPEAQWKFGEAAITQSDYDLLDQMSREI